MNRQICLRARPHGLPTPSCYEWRESPIPQPDDGELLIRNLYLSLDPGIRGWMADAPSYAPPIPVGAVMRGLTIGRIVESRAEGFAAGELVAGMHGWEDYSIAVAARVRRVPRQSELPVTSYLSVLGSVGLTAYFGVLEVGRIKPGETLLVSGAAGTVGSLAGQVARIHGCRVVGIAGGPQKCAWLVDECGFDAAIDYKGSAADDMAAALRAACPRGVDVYFENVGGPLLDTVLMQINQAARIVVCGMIADYNRTAPPAGTQNLWQLVVKSARMEGFLVMNYRDRFAHAAAELTGWIRDGKLRYREHLERGLENAPQSLLRLFSGDHQGKLIIDIAGDEP